MQDLVTPDTLDELDRRVYDLAIQHIPLAEIAVRLGVPIGQADERIQRVFARLGVTDRAGLRGLAERPPPLASAPAGEYIIGASEYVIGAEADYVIGADLEASLPARPFSRRAFLRAAGATAGVLGLAGAAGLLWDRRNARDDFPSEAPADDLRAASGVATTLLEPRPGISQGYVHGMWAPNQGIDWESGLFFMFTSSGEVSGLRFAEPSQDPGAASTIASYRTEPTRRFVWAEDRDNLRGYLLDTLNPEVSWSWAIDDVRLVAAGGAMGSNWLLFEETSGLNGKGKFHVLEPVQGSETLHEVLAFALPTAGPISQALAAEEAPIVVLWSGALGFPVLYRVALTTGRVAQLFGETNIPAPANPGPDPFWAPGPLQLVADGFIASWIQTRGGEAIRQSAHFSWNGTTIRPPTPGPFSDSWSPGGDLVAREDVERLVWLDGPEGNREYWPSVLLCKPDGEAVLRVRSATIDYGDGLPPSRWLADGSGFVTMVRGPERRGEAQSAYQYALISRDGTGMVRLPQPPPPRNGRRWFESEWIRGAMPSPFDMEWISFGRLQAYNTRTGQWRTANIESEEGPDHLDPWSAGPGAIVFALPHPGHGINPGPVLLAPKVEKSPFAEFGLQFVVHPTGGGLELLRAEPTFESAITGSLANGTRVALAPPPGTQPDVPQAAVNQSDEATWAYVDTADGRSGWVNSAGLFWA